MKTNTQDLLSNLARDPASRTKVGNDVQDTRARTVDTRSPDSGEAGRASQGETLDVARAKEVYARTEQTSSPSAGNMPETPQEAGSLASQVSSQVREDAAKAMKAQAGGVSAHLVELLGDKKTG